MDHTGPANPADTTKKALTKKALHDAVARYQRPLIAYAHARTGNLERARDAAQETLLSLCQQPADRLESEILPRLAPWLFTVCRNAVIDLHRKEHTMTTTDNLSLDRSISDRATSGGPAESAEAHDQQHHLLSLVAALPTHQREVVQLRFQGGLAYKDIAEVTGHSVSYVGVLLHEAIVSLREQLIALNA